MLTQVFTQFKISSNHEYMQIIASPLHTTLQSSDACAQKALQQAKNKRNSTLIATPPPQHGLTMYIFANNNTTTTITAMTDNLISSQNLALT